jgi:hypothetical protein
MADPTAGAQFSPFPDLHGVNVSTTYAGSIAQASALESVFHDVPHVPDPGYSANKLREFVLSRLRVRRCSEANPAHSSRAIRPRSSYRPSARPAAALQELNLGRELTADLA